MRKLGYWLVVFSLAALVVFAFRFFVEHGLTVLGIAGFLGGLVCFAVLLSFGISMRDRERRGPPIAR